MNLRRTILFLFSAILFITLQSSIFSPGEKNIRGADGVNELSKIVFNSIKLNDFEMLAKYLPNDVELEALKKQTVDKNKYMFENMNAEDLKSNTKVNFDKVVQDGIVNTLNWSEVEIQESKINMCKAGDNRMCEAVMRIEDTRGTSMVLSFDMIKLDDRWFVFQGLREKGPATKVGIK